MFELDCVTQNYKWGRKGSSAFVASLKRSSDDTFVVKEDENYAELWMGTHPSGPAKVKGTSTLLSDWLSGRPDATGTVPSGYPSDNLPFLFKVLSVETALSIQTHPDKELAAKLHSEFPDIYKDANHKPEMVIALTDFECLCGFDRISEIRSNLTTFPELAAVVNHSVNVTDAFFAYDGDTAPSKPTSFFSSTSEDQGDSKGGDEDPQEVELLQTLFKALMACPSRLVGEQLEKLTDRLKSLQLQSSRDDGPSALAPIEDLILRLYGQYGNDAGVLCPLIMNYICLKPGNSFFIGANELHAYLYGECIECMALSDNVVRAGLTPKLKDRDTLCSMLHYRSRMPNFLTPQPVDAHTAVYRPPAASCAEFEVERIHLAAGKGTGTGTGADDNGDVKAGIDGYLLQPLQCGSILLMVEGAPCTLHALHDGASDGAQPSEKSSRMSGILGRFRRPSKSSSCSVSQNSSKSSGEEATPSVDLTIRRGSVVFIPAGVSVVLNAGAAVGSDGDVGSPCVCYRAHVNQGSP